MSSQMELIMQLYMLSLMQQQHQQLLQQQQRQHQLRSRSQQQNDCADASGASTSGNAKDEAMATPTITPTRKRMHKFKKSLPTTTTSSCSRSSSPNSNASSIHSKSYHPVPEPPSTSTTPTPSSAGSLSLHQLLFKNIAPTLPRLATSATALSTGAVFSNLLLAPTMQIPLAMTSPSATSERAMPLLPFEATQSAVKIDNNSGGDNLQPLNFANIHTTNNKNNQNPDTHSKKGNSFANNFLQSSTVTSTPTENSPSPLIMEQDVSEVPDVETEDGERKRPEHHERKQRLIGDDEKHCGDGDADDVVKKAVIEEDVDYDDEDEQPLSSLQSSLTSGTDTGRGTGTTTTSKSVETSASVSGASAEGANKQLLRPHVQALESTDSLGSSNMLYTPIKQPADSSLNDLVNQQSLSLRQKDTSAPLISSSQSSNTFENDDSEIATPPQSLTNVILTPPPSGQATTSTSASTGDTTQMQIGNTQTASNADALLKNDENLKHLKKFSSYLECKNVLCRQENLREHFHCFDGPCQGKILSKKDDIIRHMKWHKKRKESLLLGFARFSSSDDCVPAYGEGCAYNWKQTHYHCVYEECSKVYVSTSDVQMHANFHRKNSEIVQEGFRRFRAHENCKIKDCPFYGKKTSHYHCCRERCQHTFKNKADMDKHKSYHLKDFQLTQDGFKKILKTEICPFDDCKFSGVSNHIHCVRDKCDFIMHSSSQMISHKRKHDRLDGERAYQSFKKQKDSSEDDSSKSASTSNVSTPLSSLPADHFLSRKRGRPPKKIQMPPETDTTKRIKIEMNDDQLALPSTSAFSSTSPSSSLANIFPPFVSNFSPAAAAAAVAAAAAAQSNLQSATDALTPNFQLTHLMALFQLQNPQFYQNLYPNSIANVFGAAAAAAAASNSSANQNNPFLGNLAPFATTSSTTNVKPEFNDKSEFKE